MDFECPEPGKDFAKVPEGKNHEYTFFKPRETTIETVLREGGAVADFLIEDWFDYEMMNKASNKAYVLREQYASLKFEQWNRQWAKEDQQTSNHS